MPDILVYIIVVALLFLPIYLFSRNWNVFKRKRGDEEHHYFPPTHPSSRRRTQFLYLILIIYVCLIVIGLISLPVGHAPVPSPYPYPTPTSELVQNLPLSSVDIVIMAPSTMQVKQSYEIDVSLVAKGQTNISDLPLIEQATPTTVSPVPVGTPGVTLKDAFNNGSSIKYEPRATATLSPNSDPFKITTDELTEQSLDQQKVTWKWAVTPQEVGNNVLIVSIKVSWGKMFDNGLSTPSYFYPRYGPYRIGEKSLRIQVVSPPTTPTPTPTPMPTLTPEPPISITPLKIDPGAVIGTLFASIVALVTSIIGGGLAIWFIQKKRYMKHGSSASLPSKTSGGKKSKP